MVGYRNSYKMNYREKCHMCIELHLVIVHAMSSERALANFFDVCSSLYKYFRKPTVARVYNGQKLKRLLEQRWTGHLATVTVIMKSFNSILSLLQEIEDDQTSSTEIRVEATGLLKAITQPSFHFISCMIHKVLSLLDPPNTLLQAHTINLFTGVSVVQSALKCVEELRCDNQFDMLWEEFHKKREEAELPAVPGQKRRREESTQWKDYVVDTTFGQTRMEGEKTECKRLYFSILDAVVGEMSTVHQIL